MSTGNMWFDKRNLPLTFPIELVKDYSNGETEQINLPVQQLILFCESSKKKKKKRKEKKRKTATLFILRYTDVFKSVVLEHEEARSTGRKKWKRVLIVVAFQLRLSRYAFIIIRNGRRRVKSLNAPWLINFL